MNNIWPKGSMEFIFKAGFGWEKDKRFVSKEGETPSEFIARILRKSHRINGDVVYAYLKREMED